MTKGFFSGLGSVLNTDSGIKLILKLTKLNIGVSNQYTLLYDKEMTCYAGILPKITLLYGYQNNVNDLWCIISHHFQVLKIFVLNKLTDICAEKQLIGQRMNSKGFNFIMKNISLNWPNYTPPTMPLSLLQEKFFLQQVTKCCSL